MKLMLRWHRSRGEREHRVLWGTQVILFVLGILSLGLCALVYFEALVSQAYEQLEFEKSLTLPHAAPPSPAVAVSRLEIPRLGVSVMVHEGVKAGVLRIGAGHIPGTAFPGEAGNVGIAAHRDTFFRPLRHVQAADTIVLSTLDGSYRYQVEWTRVVKPSDNAVLASSDDSELTLVTCYPFYYLGAAPERFVVRARQIAPAR